MKVFFLKIVHFILPFFLIIVIGLEISAKLINTHLSAAMPETEYVFLGHSQPECAIDDELIPNSKNISQGGEAYFYTYQKLKKIIQDNPQLTTVFVSFSNNQIEKEMDRWTFDNIHLNHYYAKYNFLMDFKDISLIAKNNSGYFFQANISSLEKNTRMLLKRKNLIDDKNWGGHLSLHMNKLDSLRKADYGKNIVISKDIVVSNVNIQYLKEIVNICKKNNKQVIFIRTPYSSDLKKTYNENKFKNIRMKYFQDITFWDFRDLPISEDNFVDYGHLNESGAKFFSEVLNNRIIYWKKTGK